MVERFICDAKVVSLVQQMSDTPPSDSLWPDTIHAYELTLATAQENLALDEALLASVDSDPTAAALRYWQPDHYFVVIGRSNQEASEVNLAACAAARIPIFRRASGGGAVIVGPGCLCYSLVLPLAEAHRLAGISRVTKGLMARTAAGLLRVIPDVEVRGVSDLTFRGRKFSGNAQRWLRRAFIHHGTLLFDFDVSLCEAFLNHPSREPTYRQSRRHADFVTNLPVTADVLRNCLDSAWNAVPRQIPDAILNRINGIAESRYNSGDWQINHPT